MVCGEVYDGAGYDDANDDADSVRRPGPVSSVSAEDDAAGSRVTAATSFLGRRASDSASGASV